jgi:ParB family transcriptional regulator, chromosome partitioning protein
VADDAETLEIALIENLQRKDLTAFEEADGLQKLADQYDYTHDDIARKIGRARSSVTETMSLRLIPEEVRKICVDNGVGAKSVLLQIARQPTEKKMREMVTRITEQGLKRDDARRVRKEAIAAIEAAEPIPQPEIDTYVFNFEAADGSFLMRLEFRKNEVSRDELAGAVRAILRQIETGSISSSAA